MVANVTTRDRRSAASRAAQAERAAKPHKAARGKAAAARAAVAAAHKPKIEAQMQAARLPARALAPVAQTVANQVGAAPAANSTARPSAVAVTAPAANSAAPAVPVAHPPALAASLSADAGVGFIKPIDDLVELGRQTGTFLKELPGNIRDGFDKLRGKEGPANYYGDDPSKSANDVGLLYTSGYSPPTAAGLDGGFYAYAGIPDTGGNIRAYFTSGALQPGTGYVDKLPVGTEVSEGDVLFRIVNKDIDGAVDTAKASLERSLAILPSAISEGLEGASGIDAAIGRKDDAIVFQQQQVDIAVTKFDRFASLGRSGAVADVLVDEVRSELAGERQELAELKSERGELVADRRSFRELASLSPDQIVDRVTRGDTGNLPTAIVDRASDVLGARVQLENALAKQETLKVKSPIDGIVSATIPDGTVLNSLNGTALLNSGTAAGLGEVSNDPELIGPSDQNDGSTTTVVPKDSALAQIQFTGVSAEQAKDFEVGSRVAFMTANGTMGTAEVEKNVPYTAVAGNRIILKDPTLADGSRLTAGAREPIRVFSAEKPEFEREGGSTQSTVTFGEVSDPTVSQRYLRKAEQDFKATIPIYVQRDPSTPSEILAHLDVTGRVVADRRGVKILSYEGNIRTLDGTSTPYTPQITAEVNNAGSASADSPRDESGVRLRISLPIMANNATLANAEAWGISGKPDLLEKLPIIGNWFSDITGRYENSETETKLNDNQQFQLPIDIVPTGRLTGEIAQITTPSGIETSVPENLE